MSETSNIGQALFNTFVRLDADLSIEDGFMTGTTAVVILKHATHLWVANCGDSRAILNNATSCFPITDDHKPDRKDEKARIEKSGGFIQKTLGDVWRVNGSLALSRSIGDRHLRPSVIPIPEINRIDLNRNNRFCIMATDGLWDIFQNETINNLFLSFYNNPVFSDKNALDMGLERLEKELLRIGMHDNTTVVAFHIRR
jgi:protein phosphatase 2C